MRIKSFLNGKKLQNGNKFLENGIQKMMLELFSFWFVAVGELDTSEWSVFCVNVLVKIVH